MLFCCHAIPYYTSSCQEKEQKAKLERIMGLTTHDGNGNHSTMWQYLTVSMAEEAEQNWQRASDKLSSKHSELAQRGAALSTQEVLSNK